MQVLVIYNDRTAQYLFAPVNALVISKAPWRWCLIDCDGATGTFDAPCQVMYHNVLDKVVTPAYKEIRYTPHHARCGWITQESFDKFLKYLDKREAATGTRPTLGVAFLSYFVDVFLEAHPFSAHSELYESLDDNVTATMLFSNACAPNAAASDTEPTPRGFSLVEASGEQGPELHLFRSSLKLGVPIKLASAQAVLDLAYALVQKVSVFEAGESGRVQSSSPAYCLTQADDGSIVVSLKA